nr:hypothetical protein [Burkholderia sp. WAC0059]
MASSTEISCRSARAQHLRRRADALEAVDADLDAAAFAQHRHERSVLADPDDVGRRSPDEQDFLRREFVGCDQIVERLARRFVAVGQQRDAGLRIEQVRQPRLIFGGAAENGRVRRVERPRFAGRARVGPLERQRHGDARADAFGAFECDAAVHEFGEPRADRQPEPGAARMREPLLLGLRERLEQAALQVGGNADARVGHAQFERLVDPARAQRDLARGRELERVAEQVVDDLREADRIEAQPRGNGAIHHDVELQPLADGERRVGERRASDEIGDGRPLLDEAHLAHVHLREVEHVVDDLQQPVRRYLHGLHARLLFGRERAERHELDVADERGQRRADFVAHRGEEADLRAHRRVARPLGLEQQAPGLVVRGHVRDRAEQDVFPVEHGRRGGDLEVRARVAALGREREPADLRRAVVDERERPMRLEGRAEFVGQARGVLVEAEHVARDLVGGDDLEAVPAHDAQPDGRRVHEQMVEQLAFERARRLAVAARQEPVVPVARDAEQQDDQRAGREEHDQQLRAQQIDVLRPGPSDEIVAEAERERHAAQRPAIAGQPVEARGRLAGEAPLEHRHDGVGQRAREFFAVGADQRRFGVGRIRRRFGREFVGLDAREDERVGPAVPLHGHRAEDGRGGETESGRWPEPDDVARAGGAGARGAARGKTRERGFGERAGGVAAGRTRAARVGSDVDLVAIRGLAVDEDEHERHRRGLRRELAYRAVADGAQRSLSRQSRERGLAGRAVVGGRRGEQAFFAEREHQAGARQHAVATDQRLVGLFGRRARERGLQQQRIVRRARHGGDGHAQRREDQQGHHHRGDASLALQVGLERAERVQRR